MLNLTDLSPLPTYEVKRPLGKRFIQTNITNYNSQINDEKTENPEPSSLVRKKTLKDYKYLPCVAAFLFLNFGLPRDPK